MDAIGAAVSGIALFHFIVITNDGASGAGLQCAGAANTQSRSRRLDCVFCHWPTGGECETTQALRRAMLALVSLVGCIIMDGMAATQCSSVITYQLKQMKSAGKFQGMGRALGAGSQMVAATGVGAGIGWWLDKLTGWSPVLLCIFFVLGSVAGFISVYRALNYNTEKQS